MAWLLDKGAGGGQWECECEETRNEQTVGKDTKLAPIDRFFGGHARKNDAPSLCARERGVDVGYVEGLQYAAMVRV